MQPSDFYERTEEIFSREFSERIKKEAYNRLNRVPDEFYLDFKKELDKEFAYMFEGEPSVLIRDEGCYYIDLIASSCGWYVALSRVLKKYNLDEFQKWYDDMQWFESDIVDSYITDEVLKKHGIERGK